MDAVLTGKTPTLELDEAVEVGRVRYGVTATTATDLGSERDRTFLLADGDRPAAILKVSNLAEDPATLDMEAAAAQHVLRVDPGLNVPLPRRPQGATGDGPESLRTTHDGHAVRLYDVLPGHSRIEATALSDGALGAFGETTARLARALRGFAHPKAIRRMPWDVQHALDARSMLRDVRDAGSRELVRETLDAFEARVTPVWPSLRAQVCHADVTVDNTLSDDAGLVTGIIDFGDMSHTALVADLATAVESAADGRTGDELLRAGRLVLDGYQRRTLLEDDELRALPVLWAARSAITIAISSWRVAQGLEDPGFAERFNDSARRTLETLTRVGWDAAARALGAAAPAAPDPSLRDRRAQAFGPAVDPLFYDDPIQVASASGVWITDTDGRRLLDAYNNVPCVGHAHPRVTAAQARQSTRINTHTRYLHPSAIELAERLAATCPPELDVVLLVNSGSEANDLAWRMATLATGNTGGLCTDFAYHGITEATAALSPEGWFDEPKPGHVETWDPFDEADLPRAIERLGANGHAPAATILDGIVTSDGIADLDAAHVRSLIEATRAAGGLWIADEVQAGHGRTGEALWSFERAGIVPDFVTLGKPMGNGHPVAAVITRSTIVQELVGRATLFSTFGGNPVSAAAALAVLDVLEDERVLDRVQRTGAAMRQALEGIGHPDVRAIRGVGLAWAVQLPDRERARAVKEGMRERGVLVGTTGRDADALKIRPPLAFDEPHVAQLVEALRDALG